MVSVWVSAAITFLIQGVAGAAAIALKTEKFFDLVGSLTYGLLIFVTYKGFSKATLRETLVSGAVLLARLYLSCFLFYRVLQHDGDRRFAKVKNQPGRFFFFWMMQGLWIFLTILPALFVNKSQRSVRFGALDAVGIAVFLGGLIVEVMADMQKMAFRSEPANADKFITTGLWGLSRHPNYLGEILVWVGIYLASFSVLRGAQHLAVLSPIFTAWLLISVSGIPILERMADKRWGHLPEYTAYRDNTAILVPYLW